MNILNNRNQRTSIFKTAALCLLGVLSLAFVSCDDDMYLQQSYPFTVGTMPVPKETAEMRCDMKKTGNFANTLCIIRYFLFDGAMKMAGDITFLPNDSYLFENEKFRLYYTAEGDEVDNFKLLS